MGPATVKRPASRSPGEERALKRLATSSPEEGELNDIQLPRSSLPPLPASLPPKPITSLSKSKVPFPFKKKADVSRSGSMLSVSEEKETHVTYEKSAEGEDRVGARRDSRRKNLHHSHSDLRDSSLEHRENTSRHYAPPRDHRGHRDRPRSPSPYSPPSRSPASPPSSRHHEKHRLPPPRSPPANFSPPRNSYSQERDGDRDRSNRDRGHRYHDSDRYYTPREYTSSSNQDRFWRPSVPYSSNDHRGRDWSRRDDDRRWTSHRRDERDHVRDYDRDYDHDRGRRGWDNYRPASTPPGPRTPPPLPVARRSPSPPPPPEPTKLPGTPPPPATSPPPQPPPDERLKREIALPPDHQLVSIALKKPPKAPRDVHSPPPLPLPPAKNALLNGPNKKPEAKAPEAPKLRLRRREPLRRTKDDEIKAYRRAFQGCGMQSEYEVMTKLGEGTFGEVHKAIHKETNTAVALKRILMHNEKEGMPVTALREIKILKALHHPCIVNILDMFVVRSSSKDPLSVYMVFPYMDHDLAGLLENDRVKLQPSHIKLYMKQLLEGTEYMHRNNILHRDMKAANLLISNTGSLRIADFGLARAFDGSITRNTIDGRVKERKYTNCVVTRWYRPPELLLGARQYGGEVDIWGIGCVLGEMFSRRPILPGNSDLDQLEKIWQLCGTPNQHTWPNHDALPGCEGVKRFQMHFRRIKVTYESVGHETSDLLDKLLTCNPRERITAAQALDHEYFWTDPLPADPKTLPSYEPSHEFDKRGHRNHHPPNPQPAPPHETHFHPLHSPAAPARHRNPNQNPRHIPYPPPFPNSLPHGPSAHPPNAFPRQPRPGPGPGRGPPPQHHHNNPNNHPHGPRDGIQGGNSTLPPPPPHLPQRPTAPQGLPQKPRDSAINQTHPPGGSEENLNYGSSF